MSEILSKKKACEMYEDLSEEEKSNKKQQYGSKQW